MFKSIITTGKTIGTLTAKASVATGKGTKAATFATGRGFRHLGQAIKAEYRANKGVTFTAVRNTEFPFEAMA